VTAFESYMAYDVRLLRQNTSLITNGPAALVFVSGSAGKLTWEPVLAEIAESADFGYTYGIFELKKAVTWSSSAAAMSEFGRRREANGR
jgi:hypothetical protein